MGSLTAFGERVSHWIGHGGLTVPFFILLISNQRGCRTVFSRQKLKEKEEMRNMQKPVNTKKKFAKMSRNMRKHGKI